MSKSSSKGTKVSASPNDPVIQEGPGAVKPDSLAAESQAFRQANSAGLNNQQHRPQEGMSASAHAPNTSKTHYQGGMSQETGSGRPGHTGPSDVKKPHGKNIQEDDSIGTGDTAKNASFSAEIGSKDDPSLLAERKFEQLNSMAPGSSGGREKTTHEKTAYDVLGDREA
ncbi:hypothetical protein EV127DRAFT_417561 [Xylaria flabelliformis]|nr:hypothetical protein EV127DRAFT_417561 [Xylaria flabelliformis]